ncbi:MAG: hypothetical protein CW335_06325 [Clostridiales bacterium]|nr:hypothetical protein [Clostridiales bacterium]
MKRKCMIQILSLLGLLGLIVYSQEATDAAKKALQLCGTSVIPSLFPFFVLSKILLSSGISLSFVNRFAEKVFGVNGECLSALVISLLGGYPAGAAAVTALYQNGAITKRDAEKALCFCNNSGPAFFVAFIGGSVLHSVRQGLILYCIHIISAILCGRMQAGNGNAVLRIRQVKEKQQPPMRQLPEAISESCASLLQISGLIIFFSVILAVTEEIGLFRLLNRIPNLPFVEVKAILCGIFELSGGILNSVSSQYAFVLCAFFMGWGGYCVHMQAKAIWQTAGLKPKNYLYFKLLQGLLSAIFALAYMCPSMLSVAVSLFAAFLCTIFPSISEKWGRNPIRNTL